MSTKWSMDAEAVGFLKDKQKPSNVIVELMKYANPLLEPPDQQKLVSLAGRTIRTWITENGQFPEHEPIAFDMDDKELVELGMKSAIKLEQKRERSIETLGARFDEIVNGTYEPMLREKEK